MTANVKKENNFHLLCSSWLDKISIIMIVRGVERSGAGRQPSDSMKIPKNNEVSPDDGKRGERYYAE